MPRHDPYNERKGMQCERCWSPTRVMDSRDQDGMVRRRRECLNEDCAHRFTTFEVSKTVVDEMLRLQKRFLIIQQTLGHAPVTAPTNINPKTLRYFGKRIEAVKL